MDSFYSLIRLLLVSQHANFHEVYSYGLSKANFDTDLLRHYCRPFKLKVAGLS